VSVKEALRGKSGPGEERARAVGVIARGSGAEADP
jgi:hypothetical protein